MISKIGGEILMQDWGVKESDDEEDPWFEEVRDEQEKLKKINAMNVVDSEEDEDGSEKDDDIKEIPESDEEQKNSDELDLKISLRDIL